MEVMKIRLLCRADLGSLMSQVLARQERLGAVFFNLTFSPKILGDCSISFRVPIHGMLILLMLILLGRSWKDSSPRGNLIESTAANVCCLL